MGSPFPGMDPYLENPTTWPNLHSRLIVAIANLLGPQIRPKYRVVVEEAVYQRDQQDQSVLIGVPDVSVRQASNVSVEPSSSADELVKAAEAPSGNIALAESEAVQVTLPMPSVVRHRYLEIRSLQSSDVITVIEILSPVNKRGAGRRKYESKRLEILESDTNLVEIDLLHVGAPMPVLNYNAESHYRILVSESRDRPNAQLYPFNVQQRLPVFEVPLKPEDAQISIALKPLLEEIYELSGYDLDIDYGQDPMPAWPVSILEWIERYLKGLALR